MSTEAGRIDSLGKIRPGNEREKQPDDTPAENGVGGTESRTERASAPLNPEDEALPGNARWLGRLATATYGRALQFKAWNDTYFDRYHSRSNARTAATMEGRIAILSRQNIEYARRSAQHAAEAARLENSRWNSLAVGRMVTHLGITYHAWQSQSADRKARRFDAKIDRANGSLERAQRETTYFDERIGTRVHAIEEKLTQRLSPVEEHRKKIDARMNELGDAIGHHETIIRGIRSDIEKVETAMRERVYNKKEREQITGTLKKLYTKLTLEEQSLKDAGKLYTRCHSHRLRLANAHTECETARDAISDRYTNHVERKIAPETKPLSMPKSSDTVLAELIADSTQEIAQQPLTLEAFIKIWKLTFPSFPVKNSNDFLTSFKSDLERTQGGKEALAAWSKPQGTLTVAKYTALVENLFQTSGIFREQVRRTHGTKGLPLMISRLQESIARHGAKNP